MALRDRLAQRAQPYLEPGEQIRALFWAQTGPSPYLGLITSVVVFLRKYYILVVTDRSIAVLRCGFWRGTFPKALEARLPLAPIDEPSGLWGQVHVGGVQYWVHRRFHKDVRQANASILGQAPR